MAIQTLYPSISPSLSLDFANVKALDSRVSFVRTTTAAYYDGKSVAKAEENLLLQSQTFDTTWTTERATISANTTAAPDGTTTADSVLQASGETVAGNAQQGVNVVAGDCVISVFAKPNGKNFLIIRETLLDGTLRNTWFDVQNGTIGTTNAGHTATITASTNSFYRCSIKFTVNAARSAIVRISVADTDNSTTVTDSGGLYIWGAQLEQRSAVTAYTPTTTQPITNYIPALQTALAGQARFDHNPTTGESLGLLVEEQRTNLLTYSAQFDDASWGKSRITVTSNTIVAPDGTLTGDKLVEDTTTGLHQTNQTSISFTSGTSYTLSGYYKAAERTRILLQLGNSGTPFPTAANFRAFFDLSNGTLVSAGSSVTQTSIVNVGNGWYRCSITAVAQATATDQIFQAFLVSSGTTINYLGDGYSGIFIWGAQLE
jgi:hypothetical protein